MMALSTTIAKWMKLEPPRHWKQAVLTQHLPDKENDMIATAYRYNNAQPEWMNAIARAWSQKTDAGMDTQTEILSEWRLGSVKLVVEYDLLIKEAVEAGLIESDQDYNSPK
jgi:hypothetical protein